MPVDFRCRLCTACACSYCFGYGGFMSTHDNGGPAFPGQIEHGNTTIESFSGMTLRDYFAAKAMQVIANQPEFALRYDPNQVADRAYEWADAMLKAREA